MDRVTSFDDLAKAYGYDDALDFGRRFIQERVAIVAYIARATLKSEYAEVEIGDWTGIREAHHWRESEWRLWDYNLWHRTKRTSMRVGIAVKDSATPDAAAQRLISTIHYVDFEKSGAAFLQRGKALIAHGRPEDAKFELANALYSDWGNADNHYWMARAYFDTGRFSMSVEHANHALAIRSDWKDAIELKAEAEEALKRKNK